MNIFERHDILVNSIGAFPEEIQAFEQIQLMIALGYSSLLLLTIIQIVSYYLYNGRFHPFAVIVTQNLHQSQSQTASKDQSNEIVKKLYFKFS